jgi:hypothetical protein
MFQNSSKLASQNKTRFSKDFINLAKGLCLHNENRIRILKNKPLKSKKILYETIFEIHFQT